MKNKCKSIHMRQREATMVWVFFSFEYIELTGDSYVAFPLPDHFYSSSTWNNVIFIVHVNRDSIPWRDSLY